MLKPFYSIKVIGWNSLHKILHKVKQPFFEIIIIKKKTLWKTLVIDACLKFNISRNEKSNLRCTPIFLYFSSYFEIVSWSRPLHRLSFYSLWLRCYDVYPSYSFYRICHVSYYEYCIFFLIVPFCIILFFYLFTYKFPALFRPDFFLYISFYFPGTFLFMLFYNNVSILKQILSVLSVNRKKDYLTQK